MFEIKNFFYFNNRFSFYHNKYISNYKQEFYPCLNSIKILVDSYQNICYLCRFGPDPNPLERDREGHTRGGVQTQKPDGFTKSTAVHSYGDDIQTTATLRRLEPYVAK